MRLGILSRVTFDSKFFIKFDRFKRMDNHIFQKGHFFLVNWRLTQIATENNVFSMIVLATKHILVCTRPGILQSVVKSDAINISSPFRRPKTWTANRGADIPAGKVLHGEKS